MAFDPWIATPVGRGSASKKKTARLAGREPGTDKVHVLIKLHNWAGRAIFVYNLTMSDSESPEKRMRHISRPSDEIWNQYSQLGIEIPHPGKIQATDVTKWVKYAKQEAKRHGLKVEE